MRVKLIVLMIVAALFFPGLSNAKTIEVDILKKKYIPAEVTIDQGDTVIWRNVEKRNYHNVWFKAQDKEEPQIFFPGESYSRTFNDPGVHQYECGPHPKMKGVVNVIKK